MVGGSDAGTHSHAGARFTCFTSTKVQILNSKDRAEAIAARLGKGGTLGGGGREHAPGGGRDAAGAGEGGQTQRYSIYSLY